MIIKHLARAFAVESTQNEQILNTYYGHSRNQIDTTGSVIVCSLVGDAGIKAGSYSSNMVKARTGYTCDAMIALRRGT